MPLFEAWLIDPWRDTAVKPMYSLADTEWGLKPGRRAALESNRLHVATETYPYRIASFDLSGRILHVAVVEMRAIKISDGDFRSARERLREYYAGRPRLPGWTDGERVAAARLDGFSGGSEIPPVRRMLAGAGWVWAEKNDASFGADFLLEWIGVGRLVAPHERQWDLFRPDGSLGLRISVPANIRPISVSENRMWAVVRDDLDVERIVKYSIPDNARQ
jgi:hypothetical protein